MLRRLIAYFIDWYLAFVVMNTMLVAAAYLLTGTMYAGSLPLTAFEPGAQLPLFRGPFLLHRSAIRVAGANGGQAADAPAYGCRGWWTAEFAAADATRSCRHRAD